MRFEVVEERCCGGGDITSNCFFTVRKGAKSPRGVELTVFTQEAQLETDPEEVRAVNDSSLLWCRRRGNLDRKDVLRGTR